MPTPLDAGQPSKPVTIQDIANALGIHKATVSRALSGKGEISPSVRKKVLEFAGQVGYEPDVAAQRLASRDKSHLICLCSGSLVGGLPMDKITLIQNALTKLGFEVPFYTPAKFVGNSPDAQISLFRQLRRLRPQAIVCSVHTFQDAAFPELEAYQREGGIVIAFDLPIPLACDQVIFDRMDNAYQAARHLLECGHRHLGLAMGRLTNPRVSNPNATQNLRITGFRKALSEWQNETGETLPEPKIFEHSGVELGGVELAQQLLELPQRPTALCIVSDYVALAFMSEMQRLGVRIPRDVSVIGQEDQFIAAHFPVPLTSICQPIEEITQATVDLLMERLDGDISPPRTVTVRGYLVERQSVAPPATSTFSKKNKK